MFIISIPLYVDTATVVSSRHVTSNGYPSEQGIALSNVPYVTSRISHSVVVLEPDGRYGRQLISRDYGLNEPAVIHKYKNSLLVTNYFGLIYRFKFQFTVDTIFQSLLLLSIFP
jgi:hypothetical protein